MHVLGLIDKDISKDRKWIGCMVDNCRELFNLFNWGASYEKLRQGSLELKITPTSLVNFSDTRFANSKRKVFKNLHQQFAPIANCLKKANFFRYDNRGQKREG